MKRLKYLSLRKRLLISFVAVVILAALIWALMGYPALTAEGYLRRAERGLLLPEGEILTEIDTKANGPHFLAADAGDYVEVFRIPTWGTSERFNFLLVYEKMGDLTAVVLPSQFYGYVLQEGYKTCCMLLFDERPEVQRVELSFDIHGYTYTAQADREVGGILLCNFQIGESVYYEDLQGWYMPEVTDCSAKLYDKNGVLIEETDVPMGKLIT